MRSLFLSLVLALILTGEALTPKEAAALQDAAAKAQTILAQARAALGSETKLKALTSLSVTGSYQRQMGSIQQSGEWQLDVLLPDKVLLSETFSPISGIDVTRLQSLNGDQAWMDTRNTGGAHVVMRMGGNANNPAMLTTATKVEFTRLLLGCLLTAPGNVALAFNHVGVAEAPEGKADVLEVKHGDVQVGRLFIDEKTHHPLMFTYQSRKQQVIMSQQTDAMPSEEEIEKRAKEAQERAAKAPLVEMQMRFEDFREENGLRLPHRITKGVGEETTEEINLTKFKFNPALKADHFVKK